MNINTPAVVDARHPEILIDRARSLIPALRRRSEQATAERRLPQETIDDFRRLGLTRCLQPAMFGGFVSDYRVFSKNAPHAGAGLRVVGLGLRRPWRAQLGGRKFLRAGAARRVGRKSPRGCVGERPAERSRRDGRRRLSLNGRWGFASGCDHAQWFLLNSIAKTGGTEISDLPRCRSTRPRSSTTGTSWASAAPAASRSRSRTASSPATHSVSLHELKAGTAPGATVHRDNPLYRTPRKPACAVLAEFGRRRPCRAGGRGICRLHPRAAVARPPRRRSGSVQLMVAEAAAQAETAALVGEHTIERNIAHGRVAVRRSTRSRSPGRGGTRPIRRSLRIPPSN